ncbi:MAG: large subunit ribosomal protein L24 [Parcubacteria group bacterium Athens0714_26]|nr:MAG: large subunit ribosomal protein L24 [Parcubacteria group bacterium Athens1014_26]TSD03276.1 MAG: large subunit ribosomal protein L24 [Parcubacteria group bacterium Athens0714_26]
MNIKKGDIVKILAGKDNGKNGKILVVDVKNEKVLVEGINILKKHKRPTRQGEKGEIISLPKPVHISNVMLVCQNCGKAVRVGHKLNGDKKVRYCKKCQSII